MVWLWVVLAILLIIAEIFMGTFYFVALATSALLTALSAWLWTDHVWYQILIMAICSIASMFLIPTVLHRVNKKTEGFVNENIRIKGMHATVIREINPMQSGIVKLQTGAEWTAKSDEKLKVGDSVTVVEITGSIAVVKGWHPHKDDGNL